MKEEFVFRKSLLGGFKRGSVIECIEKLQMEKIEITGKINGLEKTLAEKDEEIKALKEKLAELEKQNKELSEKPAEPEKKPAKSAKSKKAKEAAETAEGYYPPDISEINDKFSGKE